MYEAELLRPALLAALVAAENDPDLVAVGRYFADCTEADRRAHLIELVGYLSATAMWRCFGPRPGEVDVAAVADRLLVSLQPGVAPWPVEDLRSLLATNPTSRDAEVALEFVLSVAEHTAATTTLHELEPELRNIRAWHASHQELEGDPLVVRIDALLPPKTAFDDEVALIGTQDRWGCAVRHRLRDVDPGHELGTILASARSAGAENRPRVGSVDAASAAEVAILAVLVGAIPRDETGFYEDNEVLAAGACKLAGSVRADWVVPALEHAARWGATWDGNRPRSAVVARAAIDGLAATGREDALVALHGLRRAFGQRPGMKKPIETALLSVSEALGVTVDQVVAGRVPAFGFDESGTRRWTADDGSIVLRLVDGDVVEEHLDRSGELRPKRRSNARHRDALAEVRTVAKTVRRELSVLRDRLESHVVDGSTWVAEEWAGNYLGHPLVRSLSARLVWEFEEHDGWRAGVANADGTADGPDGPFRWGEHREVRLWHPARSDDAARRAWRRWIFERRIYQPLRQVFREVYSAHDVPRTGSPTLEGPRLGALFRKRGWKLPSFAPWDAGERAQARRTFDEFDLRAVVDVEALDVVRGTSASRWGFATVGPLRFEQPISSRLGAPVELHDVPVVALSEALRDLDLVVSAAAVTEHIPGDDTLSEALRAAAAFEPLRRSGEMRRDALKLLLETSDNERGWTLDDAHLVVAGRRIHIGNGLVADDGTWRTCRALLGRGGASPLPWLPIERQGRLADIVAFAMTL